MVALEVRARERLQEVGRGAQRERAQAWRGEHARLQTQIRVAHALDHQQRPHVRQLALALHARGERPAAA